MTIANDVDFAVGIGAVRDLLERNGIEPSEVGQLHRIKEVKLYQQGSKDADGNMQSQDLASVVLSPKFEEGPTWPVIQQGPLFKLPKTPVSRTKTKDTAFKKCIVFPDMQIGFYFDKHEKLVATHDPVAIDLAVAVVADEQPDLIVLVGDNLDMPEMGKYRLTPAFKKTLQPSIDYATELMFRIRAAAPDARVVWLAGNHEERLVNYVLDNAEAAFGLRQGARPDSFPVLSVPHLCRLEESGVEYLEGYPANDFWINERLRVIHGDRVKSNGSTAHVYLNSHKTSVIYGHIHRREYAAKTFVKWEGARTIMAATPGCLAKCDGAVPSTKGGIDLHGRPMTVVEDWQQGIAVVTYEDSGDHRFFYQQVDIQDGVAMYNGKLYGTHDGS